MHLETRHYLFQGIWSCLQGGYCKSFTSIPRMEHIGFSSHNTDWIFPRALGYFSDALEILLSNLFPRPPLHEWIRRKTQNDQSISPRFVYVLTVCGLKPLEHLVALIDWLIDWLIDCLVFYAVSAISQPLGGSALFEERVTTVFQQPIASQYRRNWDHLAQEMIRNKDPSLCVLANFPAMVTSPF